MLVFGSFSATPQSYGNKPVKTLVEPDRKTSAIPADAKDQFIQDLTRDGFAVLRNDIDPGETAKYADKAHDWLEGFNMGYKRDDSTTWKKENIPYQSSGIYSQFSFAHAQWVWDLKTDPRWVEAFEKIWGTKELLVSFDGGNLSIPLSAEQIARREPWPHTDQSPLRPDLYCIQSLVNLLPNGEKDGGLWVMRGSAALFPELVKAFDLQCTGRDFFKYKPEHIEWLKKRGCEWVHPDLNPGDTVFWDSREAHTAEPPEAGRPRMAVYACYKPAKDITPESLKRKQEAFEKGYCTTHDPITGIHKENSNADWNVLFPYGKPVLSESQLKYAGMVPY
ncbi:hypothetical protein QFC20_003840 [Naganishia adeliensis]|uniref:Uncharacterized protein n=1 Tax=Naganishia adeliensis TaxID=92952 RepID=A0ACC2W7N9_9TREE|nr:hypothetical protein QFC20_003840 [Naganishia adeliensis]